MKSAFVFFLMLSLPLLAQEKSNPFGSNNDTKKAHEAFAVGNSLLQSIIDGKTKSRAVLNQAIARFDDAINTKPDFIEAYFNKGICLIYGGSTNSRGDADFSGSARATACFDKVLKLDPSCADALFAKGQAQHRIGAGATTPGRPEWSKAIRPAIETLKSVAIRFPNSPAAARAKSELQEIEYKNSTGLYDLIKNRGKHRVPPIQEPMHLESTKQIEAFASQAISRIKTGIVSDKTVKIWMAHSGPTGQFSEDGRVENTNGLQLHKFYTNIAPHNIQYDDTFKDLHVEFSYDGKTVIKKVLRLPAAGPVVMAARSGRLKNDPETVVEHGNVKISVAVIDADADPRRRTHAYTSIDIRVITEIVDTP